MKSIKVCEFGYISEITNNTWTYYSPCKRVINRAIGKWNKENTLFQLDQGPVLDLNHVFVKRKP